MEGGETQKMNERIKKIRKTLDYTQQEFAERIGVKRNTIAQYEIGRNEPIDTVIRSICREFGVNESWLRSGEGEMFIQRSPDEEVGYYVEDLLEYDGKGNPFYDMIIEMMKEYRSLDDKSKAVMRDYFGKVAEGMKKRKEEEKA